jgi:CRP/FNR family nitrogen fixation transcriptional regulator
MSLALQAMVQPAALNREFGCESTTSKIDIPPLNAIGSVAHFDANETIFAEGDGANYVYKIRSGGVRLCKLLADGRRQIVDFALPDDHFGFELGDEHTITAEALEPVVLRKCARTRLARLERERQDVGQSLMHMLRRDLWAAQNHLLMLGRQTAKERVASFLLLMAERGGTEAGPAIDIPMSRQDIADYLGLTIETVCRALSDLKRDRIITIPSRHQIVVRNSAVLESMALGEE